MTSAATSPAAARVGRVQTVLGLVEPSELGPTMTHEHVLLDLRCLLEPAPAELGEGWASRPLTPDIRHDAVHHPQTNVDLQDRELNFHRVHPSTKSTLDHVMRYMAKGFTMSAAAVKSLCEACAKEGLQS